MRKKNKIKKEFTPETFAWLKKYSLKLFKKDLIAGLTVGVVALPLAMAFAIASGLPPERGIYTAIVAGFFISLFGGSRLQIGGPTGAFVVIIFDIVSRVGYEGLIFVTLLAGLILLVSGFLKLGSLIKYIPYPLITGFTTGIAVIIFTSQIKDFFGLKIDNLPTEFLPKWAAIFSSFVTLNLPTFCLGLATLILIILIRKYAPKVPWGIAAVIFATLVSFLLQLPVETIVGRFGEIPRTLPLPSLPVFSLSFSDIQKLIPDAITVAFLAGIESLLSATVADGMTGTRHKSNCELIGQGLANIGSVIFGGIPATGAIARTVINIKTGGQTPFAGMIHGVTVFIIIITFAPLVSQVPLAALSAVLLMVAWNMSELHHFKHLFKAPKSDIVILLTTFLITVLVDLTTAVLIGVILSLFLFMRKMEKSSEIVSIRKADKIEFSNYDHINRESLPPNIEIYEITGPFFFGITDRLKQVLANIELPPKVFILQMNMVPWIDASGMHALKDFHYQCQKNGTTVLLTGVTNNVQNSLKKFGLIDLVSEKNLAKTILDAKALSLT